MLARTRELVGPAMADGTHQGELFDTGGGDGGKVRRVRRSKAVAA